MARANEQDATFDQCVAWHRPVNFQRSEKSSLGSQVTALPHSVTALALNLRWCFADDGDASFGQEIFKLALARIDSAVKPDGAGRDMR